MGVFYDDLHKELSSAGANPFAVNEIRSRVSGTSKGMVKGKWMVVTEEGINNVKFYPFEHEQNARKYVEKLKVARVLVSPSGEEKHSDSAWNPFALRTIRKAAGVK